MAFTYNATLLLGSSQTGLTLKVALMDTTGTIHATIRDISTGFVEIGSGLYSWVYASMPDDYRGCAVFYTGTLGVASTFSGVTLKTATSVTPEEFGGLLTPAETAGRPTNILGMLRRLWEGRHNKRTRNRSTGAIVIRNSNDTGTLESATQGTSGSTDTQTQGG